MDKDIPPLNTEFTGRFIKAFMVYSRRTNVSDYREIDIFSGIEDAENCLEQLSSWDKGAEIKEVIVLQIGEDFILLEKMRKVEIQPIGSVPYLSPEEITKRRGERIDKLISDLDKKMSAKVTPEEIDYLMGNMLSKEE